VCVVWCVWCGVCVCGVVCVVCVCGVCVCVCREFCLYLPFVVVNRAVDDMELTLRGGD